MNKAFTEVQPELVQAHMSMDEIAAAASIPATQAIPPEIRALPALDSGIYVQSATMPALNFKTDKVVGTSDIWRVTGTERDERLLKFVPGKQQVQLEPSSSKLALGRTEYTTGYRPPWATLEYLPRLAPHRSRIAGGGVMLEPLADEAESLSYPWSTIGLVFVDGQAAGTGVLVGPNLLLTAGHIAPWGSSSWSMEFVPGLRGNSRPFGSSFVSEYRGFNTRNEVSGYDYVICRLYRPMGQALGWMGAVSFGDWAEYTRRRYFASGYQSDRPLVQTDMAIVDIDGDDPGLELEFPLGYPLGPGWSGGPLWLPSEGPLVAGTISGSEKDVLDPRRHVISAGAALVNLVQFGHDNWRP
jgi:hypothetical protein